MLSEGAGILILEEAERAKKRGARIYGEILGYGCSSDAFRVTDTHPEGRGAVQAMQNAMKDADVSPREIDYINAHGTSTQVNDRVETLAIKKVFGDRAYKIPVSAPKSMIGNLLGASGSVDLITTLLSMEQDCVLPTINYQEKDLECDLDYVPLRSRSQEIKTALIHSRGRGGINAVLAVKKV